jgi:hypothetical protein
MVCFDVLQSCVFLEGVRGMICYLFAVAKEQTVRKPWQNHHAVK